MEPPVFEFVPIAYYPVRHVLPCCNVHQYSIFHGIQAFSTSKPICTGHLDALKELPLLCAEALDQQPVRGSTYPSRGG